MRDMTGSMLKVGKVEPYQSSSPAPTVNKTPPLAAQLPAATETGGAVEATACWVNDRQIVAMSPARTSRAATAASTGCVGTD